MRLTFSEEYREKSVKAAITLFKKQIQLVYLEKKIAFVIRYSAQENRKDNRL